MRPQSQTDAGLLSTAGADPARWEEVVRRFEEEDAEGVVRKGQILFAGSSSITRWQLDRYFSRKDLVNRGFGGSLLAEVAFLCQRYLVAPSPAQIVLYAGDNDIGCGAAPAQVLASFRVFLAKMSRHLPGVPILFFSIKPSPLRHHLMDRMRETNRLIKEEIEGRPSVRFLDVFTPMLSASGNLRPELYAEDNLHLSHEGYLLWARLVAPFLVSEQFSTGRTG